jgi:hypothetical protein
VTGSCSDVTGLGRYFRFVSYRRLSQGNIEMAVKPVTPDARLRVADANNKRPRPPRPGAVARAYRVHRVNLLPACWDSVVTVCPVDGILTAGRINEL